MITTGIVSLVVASFLASSVEMVEALTIVLALGVTRGWRSTNIGVVAALVLLAVVVAILGPALTLIPLHVLQVVVGTLLLIFGLQWLRKAILRASGHKALHDEEKIFAKVWNLPFPTRRQMSCYGALQEIATYLIYSAQKHKYAAEGNEALQTIFALVLGRLPRLIC